MSEAPGAAAGRQSQNVNIAIIKGQITQIRADGDTIHHTIYLPIEGEYGRSETVQVRASRKLGELKQTVTVPTKIGGYSRKPYEGKDKDTGRAVMITPVTVTLDAIEA